MPRAARLIGVALISIVGTFAAATSWLPEVDVCEAGTALHDGDCTVKNALGFLLTDDQTRTDLETAIAPFGGQINFAVDVANTYSVWFPVDSIGELEPILEALERAGFDGNLQRTGDFYAANQSERR